MPRPDIFGADIAGLIGDALGPLTFDITLTRENVGARDPSNLAGGQTDYDGGDATASYACRGFVDQWTQRELEGTLIQAGDRKVVILGGTLDASIDPKGGDIVTVEGEDLRIVPNGVQRDPAGATYTCQCRK